MEKNVKWIVALVLIVFILIILYANALVESNEQLVLIEKYGIVFEQCVVTANDLSLMGEQFQKSLEFERKLITDIEESTFCKYELKEWASRRDNYLEELKSYTNTLQERNK